MSLIDGRGQTILEDCSVVLVTLFGQQVEGHEYEYIEEVWMTVCVFIDKMYIAFLKARKEVG